MSKIKEFIKKNKIFSLLIVVAIAIISVGIFAPIIAPYSPFEGNLSDALQPPRDRKSTRLNSSHSDRSRMPSSA